MELGPSGFPFERYIGKILSYGGFKTEVGVIVQGYCVSHEVDVVAINSKNHYMVECKYHNRQGRVNNVKIPLYIQSRFLDIKKQCKKQEHGEHNFHQGWIFTNTRFTLDAIQYAECAGLKLVSWDYPENTSLRDRINKSGLFPLTALTILTKNEKSRLLDKGIVLCKELYEDSKHLNEIGIDKPRINKILTDIKDLCDLYKSK